MAYRTRSLTLEFRTGDNVAITGAIVTARLEVPPWEQLASGPGEAQVWADRGVDMAAVVGQAGQYQADIIPSTLLPGTRWEIVLEVDGGQTSFHIFMPDRDITPDEVGDIIDESQPTPIGPGFAPGTPSGPGGPGAPALERIAAVANLALNDATWKSTGAIVPVDAVSLELAVFIEEVRGTYRQQAALWRRLAASAAGQPFTTAAAIPLKQLYTRRLVTFGIGRAANNEVLVGYTVGRAGVSGRVEVWRQ